MYEILDIYQIYTLDCLYFTYPLGFSTKHESTRVDLRSTTANLWNDSEIVKQIHQWINQIWNIHGLVGQSMDHHSARKAPLHQRSLLQIVAKRPCIYHLQIMQSRERKFIAASENYLAWCQDVYLKNNQLMNSSRRLKDTLTEKSR